MATILDLGGLIIFQKVWPFLLVFTVVYAVTGYVDMLKDNKSLRSMMAFLLAVMAMVYPLAYKTINLAAPWFVLLIFLIVFLLIAYQAFGVKQEKIIDVITSKEYGKIYALWILAMVLIITLGSLATVVSEEKQFVSLREGGIAPVDTTVDVASGERPVSEQAGFFATITHPKVLGLALILLIAFFTVGQLVER